MAPFLRVRVQSIHDNHLVLLLPDGALLSWPTGPLTLPTPSIGDELILTLTQSIELLNELLTNTEHGQATQQNQSTP